MPFMDVRMSTKVGLGFSSVPRRLTRVKDLENGNEKRDGKWSQSKRRFTAQYAEWDRAMRADLLDTIEAMEGQLYAFRFKDHNDYKVKGQPIGLAPAGSAAVQLVRTYTKGPKTTTRTITKPVASKVKVYQDGVLKAVTVGGLTGLLVPTTAWDEGAELTADFEFDVPVRFATDEVEFILPHLDICEVHCELVEVFNE
jgi:uncharacterized protein (TIGR02217 family)